MAELLVKDHGELDSLGRALFEAFDRGDVAEVLSKSRRTGARRVQVADPQGVLPG